MRFAARRLTPAVLCLLFSISGLAEDVHVWPAVDALLKGQTGTDHARALDRFQTNRAASVRQLVLLLEDAKKPRSARLSAAKMLGILRAGEAVDPLVAHMSLMPELIDDRSIFGLYPCVKALVDIGKPSTRKMLINLQTSSEPTIRKLSAEVLLHVEGHDTAIFLVKALFANEKDSASKSRLESALHLLDARK